jgi:hypothetical protein
MIKFILNSNYILQAFIATIFTYSITTLGSAVVLLVKKINKNFNSLSPTDNEKLRSFLNSCGKDLLEYQQNKINYEEIKQRLGSVINNDKH